MYSVQSLAEKFYEINPDLPVVIRDNVGNETPFNILIEDDKVVLVPTEAESE